MNRDGDRARLRALALALGFYVPHLADEALGGMHDDPLIAAAYAVFAPLGARHAAYLVFQLTWLAGLALMVTFATGDRGQRAVLSLLGFALLAELHHPIRALYTGSWNAGLLTAIPLPLVGGLLLRRALIPTRYHACSPRSSSSWGSAGSSSVSPPSSPPARARDSSDSPRATTTPPLA